MVGCVVVNSETALNIYKASQGIPVTEKYITVTGDVPNRVTVKVPVGTPVMDVLKLSGIKDFTDYAVIDGGPMMGPVMTDIGGFITKKNKGFVILKKSHFLIRKKSVTMEQARRVNKATCEQCRMCTDMCPRYLLGHNMQPHKMMRVLNYKIDDLEGQKIAQLCCQCNMCELFACPAGLHPKMANLYFKEKLADAIDSDTKEFIYTDADGEEYTYTITYKPDSKTWSVLQSKETYVYDRYAGPSKAHWLGTDTNGMDMLTRLMYGGRVSLVIGFIVVFISAFLGILLGGIAGYFGKWVDNLIMRIVDVFYCIPSTPLIIILGAAMDAMQLDPQIRMLYLMLVLGFLGWPSIARLVRGQILSLREQEFMTAAEACGIRASKRIFRHLVPNVIPQLIVTCTMSLGGTIITEATLSFLGLGVKFPFASWGNIINDVNNAYVMTNYWFIWIPAGICLLITVLGFNFVGDGLRDAFDPKMKR